MSSRTVRTRKTRMTKAMKKKADDRLALHRENMAYSRSKRLSVPFVRQILKNNVYNFIRCVEDTTFTIDSDHLTDTGAAWSFKLNDLPNVTEFTSLFDSYQIAKVELTFTPDTDYTIRRTVNNTAEVFTVPTIYVHRDLDNAVAPTSESQVIQRQDLMVKKITRQFKISVVPQVGREVYRTAVSTAYETPHKLLWLDCNYPDIPHYGIHVLTTPNGGVGKLFPVKAKAKYWIRFKTVI